MLNIGVRCLDRLCGSGIRYARSLIDVLKAALQELRRQMVGTVGMQNKRWCVGRRGRVNRLSVAFNFGEGGRRNIVRVERNRIGEGPTATTASGIRQQSSSGLCNTALAARCEPKSDTPRPHNAVWRARTPSALVKGRINPIHRPSTDLLPRTAPQEVSAHG